MHETFILVAMTYLIVKHFIFDFTSLQTPWMFLNKGTYFHPGGLSHSFIQAVASVPIFFYGAALGDGWWTPDEVNLVGALVMFEFFVHYHMDWFKMWWCREKGYSGYTGAVDTPDVFAGTCGPKPHLAIYDNKYFLWLGIDQLVHYLTYVIMIWVWVA